MGMTPYDNPHSQLGPGDDTQMLDEEILNSTEIADDVKQIHDVLKSHHNIGKYKKTKF